MNKMNLKYFLVACFLCGLYLQSPGQQKQPSKTPSPKPIAKTIYSKIDPDKLVIDSLEQQIVLLIANLESADSVNEIEKSTSADLRDRLIKLDDYRQKLESNVSSFKGENLKLNQSNRILIVFNSLVAVLLIISLVFFLRKIGKRKKNATLDENPTLDQQGDKVTFASFEDKLLQLERLGNLREKKLLSEEEFMVEKQKVLGK